MTVLFCMASDYGSSIVLTMIGVLSAHRKAGV